MSSKQVKVGFDKFIRRKRSKSKEQRRNTAPTRPPKKANYLPDEDVQEDEPTVDIMDDESWHTPNDSVSVAQTESSPDQYIGAETFLLEEGAPPTGSNTKQRNDQQQQQQQSPSLLNLSPLETPSPDPPTPPQSKAIIVAHLLAEKDAEIYKKNQEIRNLQQSLKHKTQQSHQLQHALTQRDSTIQCLTQQLASAGDEIQLQRELASKHKRHSHAVTEKFRKWEKMIQEWMKSNRNPPQGPMPRYDLSLTDNTKCKDPDQKSDPISKRGCITTKSGGGIESVVKGTPRSEVGSLEASRRSVPTVSPWTTPATNIASQDIASKRAQVLDPSKDMESKREHMLLDDPPRAKVADAPVNNKLCRIEPRSQDTESKQEQIKDSLRAKVVQVPVNNLPRKEPRSKDVESKRDPLVDSPVAIVPQVTVNNLPRKEPRSKDTASKRDPTVDSHRANVAQVLSVKKLPHKEPRLKKMNQDDACVDQSRTKRPDPPTELTARYCESMQAEGGSSQEPLDNSYDREIDTMKAPSDRDDTVDLVDSADDISHTDMSFQKPASNKDTKESSIRRERHTSETSPAQKSINSKRDTPKRSNSEVSSNSGDEKDIAPNECNNQRIQSDNEISSPINADPPLDPRRISFGLEEQKYCLPVNESPQSSSDNSDATRMMPQESPRFTRIIPTKNVPATESPPANSQTMFLVPKVIQADFDCAGGAASQLTTSSFVEPSQSMALKPINKRPMPVAQPRSTSKPNSSTEKPKDMSAAKPRSTSKPNSSSTKPKEMSATKPRPTSTPNYSVARASNAWRSTVLDKSFMASDDAARKNAMQRKAENPYKKSNKPKNDDSAPTSPKRPFSNSTNKTKPTSGETSKQPTLSRNSTDWVKTKKRKASAYNDDDESTVPDYKYAAVVRNKKKRACLPGHACAECDPFWNAVCDGNDVYSQSMFRSTSRHRAAHSPEATPPYFWELSFVDDVKAREEAEKDDT